jgi:toxin ParE1/3/4
VTLPVVFHKLAEDELNEAAAYYARTSIRLGEAFIAEVQHAVDLLAALPSAGREIEADVRWWVVKRFPYSVLYRECQDHLRILAIAHQKRRPFYWRGRV